MMSATEYRGLCKSCKNCDSCTFERDPGRCVTNCEEFDGIYSPEKNRAFVSSMQGGGSYDSEAPLGLCRTCENHGKCDFPKPEGGIWNCEEYK